MELLAGAVSALLAIINKKDKRNPVYLFCAFWSVLFILGALYWTGFDRASTETILIMLIGVVSFSFGGRFGRIIKKTYRGKKEIYHSTFIDLVCGFGCLYWTFKVYRAIPYLMRTASFPLLRKEFWVIGGSITTSLLDYIINMFFANGIALAIPAIAFTELFSGRKREFLIFGSLYMSISAALCNGGRLIFMNLAICLVGALILTGTARGLRGKLRGLPKYARNILKAVAVVIIAAGAFLTFQRQSFVSSFIESIYNYFTLQFSLMSKTVDIVKTQNDVTFGATTTMGITQPIAMIIQFLGIIEYPEIYNILSKYTSPYFDIGGSIPYNAFVSQFFFFYLDFRIFGVIVFDFLLGMLFERWYLRIDSNQKNKYTSIYIIALVAIVQSSFRFCFTYPSNVIAILIIFMTYSSKRIIIGGR
ncbi:MAG: oligosaccharide repeat unit polymerase [Eubacterium sp.]|nr:oligosaccharide repeat unit polymerase [Eubacterium sp.]